MKGRSPKRILLANPWWHAELVNGIMRNAAAHGWHVDLQTCLGGVLPKVWEGDGMITMLGVDLKALEKLLRETGCPAVSLNTNFPEIAIPRVSQDDVIAGRMAAEHFLERGFTSYAYYSRSGSQNTAQSRREAYEARLAAEGHRVEHLLLNVPPVGSDHQWLERQQHLRRVLPRLRRPLAVFATNDQAAVEVIEACMAEGIAVPDEVAVLGMLDMALFRESTTIPLSSIVADFDHITGVACDVLADLMEGAAAPEEPIAIAPTGIAVRRSTDTLAARVPEVARALRFMLDHSAESIGVSEITRAAGVSKSVLYESFQRDIGQSPGRVLSRIRIDRAKVMLRETNEKVRVVATACGFGDPVNLHRQFKRHVGTSPAAYRKKTRDEAAG